MPPQDTSPAPIAPTPPPAPEHKAIGPLAGTIIIILLLIAGGLYFWGAKLNQEMQETPYIPSDDTSYEDNTTVTSDTSAGLPAQSSSDDVSSIEADANAMNMDQLDSQNSAELNNI